MTAATKLRPSARRSSIPDVLDLFTHEDDPQCAVWRQDTGGLQALFLPRFIGSGRYQTNEIRTVHNGTTGHTCTQLRRHHFKRPMLTIHYAAPGAGVTFSGTWTEALDASVLGGKYKRSTTPGDYVEWTTPADAEVVGLNVITAPNAGYGIPYLNGDNSLCAECTTAQIEVDEGRLDPAALLPTGTLHPTDRLVNFYAVSENEDTNIILADASTLSPGSHTARIVVTGYSQVGATAARVYAMGFSYWKVGVTFGSEGASRATLSPFLYNQSSVFDYAHRALPAGTTTVTWEGCSHGYDEDIGVWVYVDGQLVQLENDEGVDGTDIYVVRRSNLFHPQLLDTPWARVTMKYQQTTRGLIVDRLEQYLMDGYFVDDSFTAMLPLDKALNRGRTLGAAAVDLGLGDDKFKSRSRSPVGLAWERDGHAAVLGYVPDVGATLDGWQHVPTLGDADDGNAPAAIQDRSDSGGFSKMYFQANDETSYRPFKAGGYRRGRFIIAAAYLDDPEAVLAAA